MRVFLERLEVAALSRGVKVNVKVTYFSQDAHSTYESEKDLRDLLQAMQKKFPKRKFEILAADGAFSRGRGIFSENYIIYIMYENYIILLCIFIH